ncbi:uncharacterized protein BKA55DRAFT_743943 [Fusarium redolens]|uniref:Uncharacterized protein n=1 Tax=Fusarium redolens TaxID=48865 RepID=A0A9P9FWS6_FUSRE|nr:uncharacterized protein BKA55DRAFT_743943 [Fusarium redolens]KAH7220459.1 hypothetical protein BKA55DRAFT_743943 [Fusarium redolens]
MSTRYFDTVVSRSAYDTLLKSDLSNGALSIVDLQASGSILPAYNRYTGNRNERLEETQEIKDFLRGPDTALLHQSTHFLIHEYGVSLGELWAALAAVKRYPRPHTSRNEGTPEAKRPRRNPVREGYVNSAGFQISSSNPEDHPSSPARSEGSAGYTEPEPTKELAAEDSAVLLITRVLRHLLYYTQPPKSSRVVEFRPERRRMISQISELEKQIVAIDDGGLSLKVDEGLSTEPDVTVALLEAKRRLVVHKDKPRISDECLAQMTCEAILARGRSDLEQLKNERTLIINATSHYVCFLEFHVTSTYMDELGNGSLPSQPLKVTATQWFDLSDRDGRSGVLENIRGLVGMAMDDVDEGVPQ